MNLEFVNRLESLCGSHRPTTSSQQSPLIERVPEDVRFALESYGGCHFDWLSPFSPGVYVQGSQLLHAGHDDDFDSVLGLTGNVLEFFQFVCDDVGGTAVDWAHHLVLSLIHISEPTRPY